MMYLNWSTKVIDLILLLLLLLACPHCKPGQDQLPIRFVVQGCFSSRVLPLQCRVAVGAPGDSGDLIREPDPKNCFRHGILWDPDSIPTELVMNFSCAGFEPIPEKKSPLEKGVIESGTIVLRRLGRATPAQFEGSCARAEPAGDLSQYRALGRTFVTNRSHVNVRSSPLWSGLENMIGKLPVNTWVFGKEYWGGKRNKGHGLIVPLRDSKGNICRGYLYMGTEDFGTIFPGWRGFNPSFLKD